MVIVEGYMDCVMPYQFGIRNVVASLGTALTTDQIRLLKRYTKNVVMLFDSDWAGQAAVMRSLDVLIEEGLHVKVALLDEGEDPDTYLLRISKFSILMKLFHICYGYPVNLSNRNQQVS